MRLATKITLPFVALFGLLILLLGAVLAREILLQVETHVENEQRLVLEVATIAGFAPTDEMLSRIRDTGRTELSAAHGDFIVLPDERPPGNARGSGAISTFPKNDAVIAAFSAAVQNLPRMMQNDERILRDDVEAAGQKWLVLHTSRTTRAPGPARWRFYLLYPYGEIERTKDRALWRMIALGGAGLGVAAALGLLVGHWISRPVRRLAAAAQRISAGGLSGLEEFPAVPPTESRDEIGELALAFQTMLQSLRASQNELLKAERLAVTGKVAASVAHEIRNPLTSLRMTAQMLLQRASPADTSTREACKILITEIDRLGLAVDDLLTVARPRPAVRVPTDLNQLVRDTLTFMERQLAHSKVGASAELDAGMPPGLMLDGNKIRQLLFNLLLNAQQAIVRDGKIIVSTRWDAPARIATLSVADSGPGVNEAVREKIFELFVTTKTGGGGLGLAIVKQIAEEHRGSVSFESSPQGTVFNVTLPEA